MIASGPFANANVLVTGGAGFIGSHLVQRLLSQRARVTVLDNFSRTSSDSPLHYTGDSVRLIRGDIRDRDCVEAACAGQDVVFHLAAQSSVMRAAADWDESFTSNVAGTFEVLRAAKLMGAKHCVFASSREVYGDPARLPVAEDAPLNPKNAYGVSKLAGELYCRAFEDDLFRVSVLRLANVYGPGDLGRVIPLFLGQAVRNEDLVLYGGGQVLDFVWIHTVVDAFLSVALSKAPTGPLNIGSGAGITVQDLARRIVNLSGSRSRIIVEPARSVETVGFIADITNAKQKLHIDVPDQALDYLPLLFDSVTQPA